MHQRGSKYLPADPPPLWMGSAVILLPAHPASFAHKFFISASPGESRDAIVLQTCH